MAPERRLRVDIEQVRLPTPLNDRLPTVHASLYLPQSVRPRNWTMIAGSADLEVPWEPHPQLASVLIPSATAEELRWSDRWRFEYYLTPDVVGLSFSDEALTDAAWAALVRIGNLPTAIRLLARLIERVDAAGLGAAPEASFLGSMRLPEAIERRVALEMSPRRPLLDPRCLRWILAELCVALVNGGPARPEKLSPQAQVVADTFFRFSTGSGIGHQREFLRALWFLHAGFNLGPGLPKESDGSLALLSMTSAYAAGVHFHGGFEEQLARAAEMWSLDADDEFLSGRDVDPAAIRSAFTTRAGLPIGMFLGLAGTYHLALRAMHLEVPEARAATVRIFREFSPHHVMAFRSALTHHMGQSPRKLGRNILAEMRRYKMPYNGLGTLPRHAPEALRDRPFLNFDEQPTLLGMSMFIDRAVQLPVHLYGKRREAARRGASGQVGHLFEARMQHRIAHLSGRHWVASGPQIDEVVRAGEKRPDALIGSGDRHYLAVEINSSRLQTGVISANTASVKTLVERYLGKRAQADALVANAPRIITALRGQAVIAGVVPLLVVQEPLMQNPAFERVVEELRPGDNPRFVCSADEFELLLELGEKGWDVPQLVANWQRAGFGQMLGTALRRQIRVTPGIGRSADKLVRVVQDGRAA